jgi:hypothetical protein
LTDDQSDYFGNFIASIPGGLRSLGYGLDFDLAAEIMETQDYSDFKYNILTSFYLPGFVIGFKDIPQQSVSNTSRIYEFYDHARWITRMFKNSYPGSNINDPSLKPKPFPIYSNWMTTGVEYDPDDEDTWFGDPKQWQEIGFYLPADREMNEDQPLYTGYVYIYSPTWAIKNNIWNIDEINLFNFFKNISTIPGRRDQVSASQNFINWRWIAGVKNTDGDSWRPIEDAEANNYNRSDQFGKLTFKYKELIRGIVGIHLPDYSIGTDENPGIRSKTIMRVI